MADELNTQFAEWLSVIQVVGLPTTAQPGQLISASLAPLPASFSITEIISQLVTLDVFEKQVVFEKQPDPNNPADMSWLTDDVIDRPQQLFNLNAGVVPTLAQGVPGIVGTLSGDFPIALQVFPRVTIEWTITEDDGDIVEEGEYQTFTGRLGPLLELTFLPIFTRYEGVALPFVGRNIAVKIRIEIGEIDDGTLSFAERVLGPFRIVMPNIPFPQVLALTKDLDFKGPAVIFVPTAYGFDKASDLLALLRPIRDLISTLGHIASLVEMLTGIDALTRILSGTEAHVYSDDSVNDLQDYTLDSRWGPDIRADDELSSFVYIAPPPAGPKDMDGVTEEDVKMDGRVLLCNNKALELKEGALRVGTGIGMVALCRSLHMPNPRVLPPDATLRVVVASTQNNTFGNELNSLEFLKDEE